MSRRRLSTPGSQPGTMDCGTCGGRYGLRSAGGEGYSMHKLTAGHVAALDARGSRPFWLQMDRKQQRRRGEDVS